MTIKERFDQASKRHWLWFAVWTVLTILFSFWANSPLILLLILLFLIFTLPNSYLGDFGRNLKTLHSEKQWNG